MNRKFLAILFVFFWGVMCNVELVAEESETANEPARNEERLSDFKKRAFYHITKTHYYDSALFYSNKGILLSKQINNQVFEGKFLSYKGLIYKRKGEFDSAIAVLKEAVRINKIAEKERELSIVYTNLGVSYYKLFRYDDALIYYNKGLAISKKIGRTKGITGAYNNIGVIYKIRGDFTKAIEYYEKALAVAEKDSLYKDVAAALGNIGNCNEKIGDYHAAIDFYNRAVAINRQIENFTGLSNNLINLGKMYSLLGDKTKALRIYQEALGYSLKTNNSKQIAVLNSNMSAILITQGKYNAAIEYAQKAYQINEDKKYFKGIVFSLQNMSEAYEMMGNRKKAEELLEKALDIASRQEQLELKEEIYSALSNFYKASGNVNKAFDYYVKADIAADSVLNSENASKIEEFNIKYESLEKEKKITEQQYTIELQNKKLVYNRRINIVVLIVLALSIVFSLIFVRLYLQKRRALLVLVRQNRKMAQNENELNDQKVVSMPVQDLSTAKYRASTLSEEDRNRISTGLDQLIHKEEIFRNSQLTVEMVAEKLSTNRRYLSQYINETYNKNFNMFINGHRVRVARKMLLDPSKDNLTIEAIASEAGFHSRGAFHNAFKSITGVTPSFFKKNRDK